MEEITYSHIPIATLITAFMLLAPLFEYLGVRRKEPKFERLSKGMIWFVMILFSPGAALGTGIPVFIIGTYPEFWSRWSNLFFWPLVVQFGFFLAEVGFLFFGYYLTWDRWQGRLKKLHIWMGVLAAVMGFLVQIVWDALGGYMLTPGKAAFPAVTEPVGWSAAAFFNPSFPLLLAHRVFGNFSYVMLLVGGYYAIKYMRRMNAQEPDRIADRDYFKWSSNLMFTIGLFCFFAQPVIGWFYAQTIHTNAPPAFAAIMGGHQGFLFTLKMTLILVFLIIGATYLSAHYKSKWVPILLSAGILGLLVIIAIHPPLHWLGSDTAWYVVSSAVLVGIVVLLWAVRGRFTGERKAWRWAMFIAGLAAFFVFCFGGFIREACKNPQTVYGYLDKPEKTPMEADRWLMYKTCLPACHADSPSFLERSADKDWDKIVPRELARPGSPKVSDDEARRIEEFLKERYP